MKKKQIKHFVRFKEIGVGGTPACNRNFYTCSVLGEVAGSRKTTTCKTCRRTRVFRKLK